MTVDVQPSPSGHVVVVSLVGDHDIATAPDVRRTLQEASSASVLVLDLGRTTFLDSTVLGVLMAARKAALARGGRICAINAAGSVAKVLRITHLDAVLQVSTTEDPIVDLELEQVLGSSAASS